MARFTQAIIVALAGLVTSWLVLGPPRKPATIFTLPNPQTAAEIDGVMYLARHYADGSDAFESNGYSHANYACDRDAALDTQFRESDRLNAARRAAWFVIKYQESLHD